MSDTRTDATVIRICVDCLFDEANGECGNEPQHGCDSPTFADRWAGYHMTLGAFTDECGHADDDEAHAEECERLGFSWSDCEWCGSSFGGDRFAAVAWPDNAGASGTSMIKSAI